MGRPRLTPLALGVWVALGGVSGMANEKKATPGFRLGKDTRSVVVTRYAKLSDARDTPNAPDKKRVSVIRDVETVGRLVKLINSLPPKGTVMIKMGDVEWIRAEFYGHYDKPPVVVELYNGWVKSPDTSFYEGLPQEKEIFEILSKAKPNPNKGLRVKKPVSVRIEEYDHAFYINDRFPPNRSAEVKDRKTVKELAAWVNALPLKGEMFVSFTAGVATTHLYFVEPNGSETLVNFYNNSVSTTDGSFYAGSKTGEELQGKIWAVVQSALGKVTPPGVKSFEIENAKSVFLELRNSVGGNLAAWKSVDESKQVKRITSLLRKLPAQGDVLKEWGENTEVLTMRISQPGVPMTVIEFYEGRIMTPSGAFYPAGKNPEASLYKLLKEQLKEGK